MSQFYNAIKWVLGSTQVALICRGKFKGDVPVIFSGHVVMVSRLCDDGVQGRDGRCVENSSCFQMFFWVPVCILLLEVSSWAN